MNFTNTLAICNSWKNYFNSLSLNELISYEDVIKLLKFFLCCFNIHLFIHLWNLFKIFFHKFNPIFRSSHINRDTSDFITVCTIEKTRKLLFHFGYKIKQSAKVDTLCDIRKYTVEIDSKNISSSFWNAENTICLVAIT